MTNQKADTTTGKRSSRGTDTDLGELHALLVKGLPDYIGERGLNARKLADDLGISYQAIYKWFERESIPPIRIVRIVELSGNTKKKLHGFVPLERDDFWPFMA